MLPRHRKFFLPGVDNLQGNQQGPGPSSVDIDYRKCLLKRKQTLLRGISDPKALSEQLRNKNVLDGTQHRIVISRPFLHQQTQVLVEFLLNTRFAQLGKIIEVMSVNPEMKLSLEALKDLIMRMPSARFVPLEGQQPENCRKGMRFYIQHYSLDEVLLEFKAVSNLEELAHVDNVSLQSSLHTCMTRTGDVLECMRALLERYRQLEQENRPGAGNHRMLCDFVDLRDKNGYTAAHLAAQKYLEDVSQELILKYHANIFIKDEKGRTPLDILYSNAPNVVEAIMDNAFSISKVVAPEKSKQNIQLSIDFGPILPESLLEFDEKSAEPESNNVGDDPVKPKPEKLVEESRNLFRKINQNPSASKKIITTVLVRTFLDLKWTKMSHYFQWALFYIFLLHLFYTLFLVQVFLIECQYEPTITLESNATSIDDYTVDNTILSLPEYFLGDIYQAWTIGTDFYTLRCHQVSSTSFGLGCFWCLYGFLRVVRKMFYEPISVYGTQLRDPKKDSQSKVSIRWSQLLRIMLDPERIVQIFHGLLEILVSYSVIIKTPPDPYRSLAAVSVILCWGLFLMLFSKVFQAIGLYVEIFTLVTQSLLRLFLAYTMLVLGYAIAFGILFPAEPLFRSLPSALTRVVVMMTGELDYKDLFEQSSRDPRISAFGYLIFAVFSVIMAILLMNFLLGIVVSDVAVLRERAEIVQAAKKIEYIFFWEHDIVNGKWFAFLRNWLYRSKHVTVDGRRIEDIYVVTPSRQGQRNVIYKDVNEISEDLLQQIRAVLNKERFRTPGNEKANSASCNEPLP